MDVSRPILPLPLWLEYSRLKRSLAQHRQSSPNLDISQVSLHHSCLAEAPCQPTLRAEDSPSDPSISLSDNEAEVCKPRLQPQVTKDVGDVGLKSRESPLKRSITTLKRSVADLKKSSQKIYKHLSHFSISSRACTPTPLPLFSALLSRTRPPVTLHPKSLPSVDIGTQIDPPGVPVPAIETSNSVGKLSFSLADGKPDLLPLLISEEENTGHSYAEEGASTAESIATPAKVKGIGQKRETLWHTEPGFKRSNTMTSLPSSTEARTAAVYYLKVAVVNGRYYDTSGTELVLGRQANQGIALKGKDTTGGFRLFTSAKECMNSDLQPASPRKGSRVGLMKVSASGASLRYSPNSLSDQEVVFTSITPQDVMPMIAANVLVTTPPSHKRKF